MLLHHCQQIINNLINEDLGHVKIEFINSILNEDCNTMQNSYNFEIQMLHNSFKISSILKNTTVIEVTGREIAIESKRIN